MANSLSNLIRRISTKRHSKDCNGNSDNLNLNKSSGEHHRPDDVNVSNGYQDNGISSQTNNKSGVVSNLKGIIKSPNGDTIRKVSSFQSKIIPSADDNKDSNATIITRTPSLPRSKKQERKLKYLGIYYKKKLPSLPPPNEEDELDKDGISNHTAAAADELELSQSHKRQVSNGSHATPILTQDQKKSKKDVGGIVNGNGIVNSPGEGSSATLLSRTKKPSYTTSNAIKVPYSSKYIQVPKLEKGGTKYSPARKLGDTSLGSPIYVSDKIAARKAEKGKPAKDIDLRSDLQPEDSHGDLNHDNLVLPVPIKTTTGTIDALETKPTAGLHLMNLNTTILNDTPISSIDHDNDPKFATILQGMKLQDSDLQKALEFSVVAKEE